MRAKILILIAIALMGLAAVVSVAGFNLQRISQQIRQQQETTAVLDEAGASAHRRTLELRLRVAALFDVKSEGDLAAEGEKLNAELTTLSELLQTLKDSKFQAVLALTVEDGRTLQQIVTSLEAGMTKLDEAAHVAGQLAGDHLALSARLGPAKDGLSKAFRACLDLQIVDAKGFNLLTRGVITTMSTDSGRDVKFAGNAKFNEGVAVIAKANLSPSQRAAFDALVAAYGPAYELIREHLAAADDSAAFTRVAQSQLDDIVVLRTHLRAAFVGDQNALVMRSRETLKTTLLMAGGIAVLSLASGLWMARSMTCRLHQGSLALDRVRKDMEGGDLTSRVGLQGRDEMASMSATVDSTLTRLQGLMSQMAGLAQGVSQGTETLQQSSARLSEIATTNSSCASDLGVNVGKVRIDVESAANNAQGFSQAVQAVAESSRQAADLAKESVVVVNGSEQAMQRLRSSTKEIGDILEVITQITRQTQLLSLNAAIEAASAGPAGRGFTVVANEVKALAVKTANAAVEIKQKIDVIQQESRDAGEAIARVGGLITSISAGQDSIALATGTQADATQAVAQNLTTAVTGTESAAELTEQMMKVAIEAAQASRQVAETAANLAARAEDLKGFVASHRY
jgi:methyl-accepting chemotaxis protein